MDSLERAELLIGQKRYDQAEEHLNKVLAELPNHPVALAYKALIRLNTKRSKDAIKLAEETLATDPGSDFALYIMAAAYMDQNDTKNAENSIVQAISFSPYRAEYYGLYANIKLMTRDFSEAEELAIKGLEIDAESLLCRNVLSTALLKQGKKDESFNTIEKALEMDPNNPMSHANYGWAELEKGSHKKALDHFREALSKNPENEFARAGMLEALKAKFFLYRLFLRYYFFMANLKPHVQWVVIIGILIIQRSLGSESLQAYAPFLEPISYLLIFFAVSTWVIHPIFNFFMSINSYAKYLLTPEDTKTSIGVGISFAIFTLSLLGLILTFSGLFSSIDLENIQVDGFWAGALVGYTLILPLGRILTSKTRWVRIFIGLYSFVSACFGILFIVASFYVGIENTFLLYYGGAVVAFSWVWNFIGNK